MKITGSTIVPWFGAGISILPPSCLPLGIPLTYKWLEYLADKDDADYIKIFFNRYGKYLEKNCPRLEKVIEDFLGDCPQCALTRTDTDQKRDARARETYEKRKIRKRFIAHWLTFFLNHCII